MINIDELPKKGGIYKITSPSNKIYIGKTKNLKYRINKYSKLDCQRQRKLYHSFLKYGFENHTVEILFYSDNINELNNNEILFIKEYNTYNTEHGLNLTEGGDGMRKKHSEVSKIKIGYGVKNSEKYKLATTSKEYRKKLSNSLMGHEGYGKGQTRTKEDIAKIKEGLKKYFSINKPKEITEKTRLLMSENTKGENNPRAKKIEILYNGEIIKFNCQKCIKPFLNDLNIKLKLFGPKRYSFEGLIKNGKTNDIVVIK